MRHGYPGLLDTMPAIAWLFKIGATRITWACTLILLKTCPIRHHRDWHNLSLCSSLVGKHPLLPPCSGSGLQLKNRGNWWVSLKANKSTSSGPSTWLIFKNTLWDSIYLPSSLELLCPLPYWMLLVCAGL